MLVFYGVLDFFWQKVKRDEMVRYYVISEFGCMMRPKERL